MKWVVLNADLKLCRDPFRTEAEAKASAERSGLPLGAVTVKCVDEDEARRLMDQHFRELDHLEPRVVCG
jgi:hypothetical protein